MMKFGKFSEPIAVIGRGCRLPGANGLNAYWDLILSGKCTQAPLPAERLNRELLFDPHKGVQGKSYAQIACLTEPADLTAATCRLPSWLKEHPEQTYATLASVALEMYDDAKFDPLDPPTDNVGVFIGHARASGLSGDIAFANYIRQVGSLIDRMAIARDLLGERLAGLKQALVDQVRSEYPDHCRFGLGASNSAKAISDAMRLTGPYMAFNAACASSTQALIQAVRSLQVGRVEMAICGGASYCHHDTLVLFSQAQSLSAAGTRPWDADADGLVVGEGFVTLLLCRMSDAIAHGYPIHGLIRGVGLSSDGKGKSLWAPRKEGQVLAINRAYRGDLRRGDVGYIEAHATSTQVGDATEIIALAESYQSEVAPGRRIPIGSVKATIGHTLETAGIAGLLKCLLAMEHETIPPVRHVVTPNPKIDWDRLPLELPLEPRVWQPGQSGWLAGVNAFGIGGLNTHVVVERPRKIGPLPTGTKRPDAPNRHCSVGLSEQSIAVIGVGCILPGEQDQHGCEAFWQRLADCVSSIVPLPSDRWDHNAYPLSSSSSLDVTGLDLPTSDCQYQVRSRLGGVVQDYYYDWKRHRVPPKQVANASPLQFMILDAVDAACTDASIEWTESERLTAGVVTGTSFGGEFSNQLQMGLRLPELRQRLSGLLRSQGMSETDERMFLDAFAAQLLSEMPAILDETGSFTSSSLASRVTKSLNLMGGATAVDSGNGSAGAALLCCADQLLCGDSDLMICIGAQQDLGPSRYVGMTRAGALGGTDKLDGIFPAEGCVVLILQRHEDAVAQGRRIHATIDRIASAYVTASHESTLSLAAQRLLEPSNPEPLPISEVELNASGDSEIDQAADGVLRWSTRNGDGTPPPVQHDASRYVGNLAGGSMAVSILAAIRPDAKQSPRRTGRVVIGGGPFENSYQLLLRDS